MDQSIPVNFHRAFLWGPVDEQSAYKLTKKFFSFLVNPAPVYLYIHSEGGCVDAAAAIMNGMDCLKENGIQVYTIVNGKAYSAAADIAVYGSDGCRFAMTNSSLMFHHSSYSPDDYTPNQKKTVEFTTLREAERTKRVARLCGKKSKKFLEEIKEGLWLTTQDAIKWGLIDGIWEHKWDAELKRSDE